MTSDQQVLDVFYNDREADLVEGVLREDGITCQRSRDDLQALGLGVSPGKTTVRVAAEDFVRAQELVAEFRKSSPLAEGFVTPPPDAPAPEAKWVDVWLRGSALAFLILLPMLSITQFPVPFFTSLYYSLARHFPLVMVPSLGHATAYLIMGTLAGGFVALLHREFTRAIARDHDE